jgi:two-component system osmolarity sensor histidine kinase EnvZ
MVGPVRTELRRLLGYGAVAAGLTASSLLLMQLLVGSRLEQAQIEQLGSELASSLVLGEVALERFSPAALARISGLPLAVGAVPAGSVPLERAARPLRGRADRLQRQLCRRLGACPVLRAAAQDPPGVWVEMASPLETIWVWAPLPSPLQRPPDPLALGLGFGVGGLGACLLFLSLEVQRPLRRLEEALAAVGLEAWPAPVPARGSRAVRQLTQRFNTMLERLERAEQERTTMLAGLAHDLRSPLTRLRLRLEIAASGPMSARELDRATGDIAALERITSQFLAFAAVGQEEPALELPLEELLAETAAQVDSLSLDLDLVPLRRRVRPIALARAVANLLDNASSHGRPPLRLVLRPWSPTAAGPGGPAGGPVQGPAEGFEIQVWDQGPGIAAPQWQTALQPFQRLDAARSGQGHCGLGLAIAERVARDHGGGLERLVGAAGSGVALRGLSLPDPTEPGHIQS